MAGQRENLLALPLVTWLHIFQTWSEVIVLSYNDPIGSCSVARAWQARAGQLENASFGFVSNLRRPEVQVSEALVS